MSSDLSGQPLSPRLRAAIAAVVLLPFALLLGRAVADILLTATALLFLWESAAGFGWGWLRTPWVRIGLAFWLWLCLCTATGGSLPALGQAAVTLRLLLFAVALQAWVLRPPAARRWLAVAVAVAAAWVALEVWQQLLTGTNIEGDPRWGDGALTGPFLKPRAGGVFLALFFPAVLPPVMRLLRQQRLLPRLGAVLLLVGACATMVLIGQRMPTLLMVLGLCVSALLLPRFRLPVVLALAAAAVLLALLPLVSPPTFAKLVVHFADQMAHFPESPYGLLFARATVMTEAHPWLGLGFNGFRDHCPDPAYLRGLPWLGIPTPATLVDGACNLHPHNYYLEAATEAGLPGLVLFVALVAVWLRGVGRAILPAADPVRVALFAWVFVSLWPVASTMSMYTIDSAGWIFLGLGWGLAEARAVSPAASCPGSSARADRVPA
jgi:O-antigen ligase